jgi:hypothetical protein
MANKTFKAKTPSNTNYVIIIDGLFFAVRKNNKGYWKSVSYKSNMVCTDNYECTVLDGFTTKKEAINFLLERVKECPKYFFHND